MTTDNDNKPEEGDDGTGYSTPERENAARRFLRALPIGQDPSAVARRLLEFGIHPRNAATLMKQEFGNRHKPPMNEALLSEYVNTAFHRKWETTVVDVLAAEHLKGAEPVDYHMLSKALHDTGVLRRALIEEVDEEAEEDGDLKSFTADQLEGKAPPETSWIVEDLIIDGDLSLVTGNGGVGKIGLMAQLACSVVFKEDWIGRPVSKQGDVLFFSAEEPGDEEGVMARIVHQVIGCDSSPYMSSLADGAGLKIIDLSTRSALLGALDTRTNRIRPTALYKKVEAEIKRSAPTLVIFDALYDIYGGGENDRSQVSQFCNLMRRLARKYGVAIVITSHPSMMGMREGTGTSGSTAWHNKVRSRLYLDNVRVNGTIRNNDVRELRSMKQNYGKPAVAITLAWEGGVFNPVEENPTQKLAAEEEAKAKFLAMLDRYTEERRPVSPLFGSLYAPKVFAEDRDAGDMDKEAFKVAMDELLKSKAIATATVGPPSKQRTIIVRGTAPPLVPEEEDSESFG